MAITAEHYLRHHQKRRKPWRWILTIVLSTTAAYAAILATGHNRIDASRSSISKDLELVRIGHLPAWARDVIHAQELGSDYQFVAAIVDLDRDQQFEILLAPAAPTADVFVANRPLAVLRQRDDIWHYEPTPVSCRPTELGSFMSNGSWDLTCRTSSGRTVLRWTGAAYVRSD